MDDPADAAGPDPDRPMANQAAMANWETVIEDMDATAAEYEAAGWDTLQIHPGDVAVLDGEGDVGPGFDVVVPDPEFADLVAVFADGTEVDEVSVFKAAVESVTYLVVVLEHAAETAVLVPCYYRIGDGAVETAFRRATATGEFRTRLRTLTGDEVVVGHEDPDLFAPPESSDDGSPGSGEGGSA